MGIDVREHALGAYAATLTVRLRGNSTVHDAVEVHVEGMANNGAASEHLLPPLLLSCHVATVRAEAPQNSRLVAAILGGMGFAVEPISDPTSSAAAAATAANMAAGAGAHVPFLFAIPEPSEVLRGAASAADGSTAQHRKGGAGSGALASSSSFSPPATPPPALSSSAGAPFAAGDSYVWVSPIAIPIGETADAADSEEGSGVPSSLLVATYCPAAAEGGGSDASGCCWVIQHWALGVDVGPRNDTAQQEPSSVAVEGVSITGAAALMAALSSFVAATVRVNHRGGAYGGVSSAAAGDPLAAAGGIGGFSLASPSLLEGIPRSVCVLNGLPVMSSSAKATAKAKAKAPALGGWD